MEENRLGKRLKLLRKQEGMSQSEVAEKLGIIRQTYSHYETGRIIPTTENLYRLSQIYHVSAESLLLLLDTTEAASGDCLISAGNPLETSETGKALLSTDEEGLLEYYRSLPKEGKKEVLLYAKFRSECKAIGE